MTTYEVNLTEAEENSFGTWWRSLTTEEQEEIRGTVIEPAGFVSPFDWFASLPKYDREAYTYTIDWDALLCESEEQDCANCAYAARCNHA